MLQGLDPNSIVGVTKEHFIIERYVKNEFPDRLIEQIRQLTVNRVSQVEALDKQLTEKLQQAIRNKRLTLTLAEMSKSEIDAVLRCDYLYDGQLLSSLFDTAWTTLHNLMISDQLHNKVIEMVGGNLFLVCMVAREKALHLDGLNELLPHLKDIAEPWAVEFHTIFKSVVESETLSEQLSNKLRLAIENKCLTMTFVKMSKIEFDAVMKCRYLHNGQLLSTLFDSSWLNLYNSTISDQLHNKVIKMVHGNLFLVCMVAREKALHVMNKLRELQPYLQQIQEPWAIAFNSSLGPTNKPLA